MAVGGGTPTYLAATDLERLFRGLADGFGAPVARLPSSVECSPETADEERLEVLARWNVRRLSMGVQSFHDHEVRRLGRLQRRAEVLEVVQRARRLGFPRLNLDLIYGIEGQTPASFLESVDAAIGLEAEEVYLHYKDEILATGAIQEVLFSIDGGATFEPVPIFSYSLGAGFDPGEDPFYAERVFSVPAAAFESKVVFAWHYQGGGNEWWWAIDDVYVTGSGEGLDSVNCANRKSMNTRTLGVSTLDCG